SCDKLTEPASIETACNFSETANTLLSFTFYEGFFSASNLSICNSSDFGYNLDARGASMKKAGDCSGLRVRLDMRLREQFVEACRMQDRTAAQVLREFMREYVAKNYC